MEEHIQYKTLADEGVQHLPLRLWLRLLTSTKLVENHIRGRLRETHETTLPRFDLMAQLARHPEGLKMGELSQLMMVTGGNVTGITDQLEKDGLVERLNPPHDRRAYLVRLTAQGKETFAEMAAEHERWIDGLMDGLTAEEQRQLYALLGKLKKTIQERENV
jgi:DNA-binding MarR family transcriptional regulator